MKAYHQIDDPIRCAETGVRTSKPICENAVFGNAIQDTVRAHNGCVDGAGKDHNSDHDDESVEEQFQAGWPNNIHCQAADEIVFEAHSNVVGNNGGGEKGNKRREDEAVNEDDHRGLFEIWQLGVRHFSVDLRERFKPAHSQHGMAERHQDSDDSDSLRQTVGAEPAQRIV